MTRLVLKFNYSVQETDGSFFESFTALSWKQKNRRRAVLQEVEARAEGPPPPSRDSTLTSQQYRLSKKEVSASSSPRHAIIHLRFSYIKSMISEDYVHTHSLVRFYLKISFNKNSRTVIWVFLCSQTRIF
jgi:hypothetical protein